jgi:excisionase family DNA binding protein
MVNEMTAKQDQNWLSDRLALRPKEAAIALGVSERTLRQMLPELPHVRLGSRVVIPVALLEEWLRTHSEAEENRVGSEVESILDALGEGNRE